MKTYCLNVLALALVVMIAGGCLVTAKSTVDEAGTRVSLGTLEQIEPHHTTEQWLLATLGPPTARNRVDRHTEVLRYAYTREENSRGSVFLIFRGGSQSRETQVTLFEVTDGIVTRHWTER